MELTFSRLIIQILQDQNLNLTQLHKELYDLGLNITYASLYGYYTGKMVPPFSKAKEILLNPPPLFTAPRHQRSPPAGGML